MENEKVLASGELNEAILIIEHVLGNYSHLTEEEHTENLMFEFLGYNKFLKAAVENINKATTVFAELAENEAKKQDELVEGLIKATISPSEEEDIIKGDTELWIGDTNVYTINPKNRIITWGLTNNDKNVILGVKGVGECEVIAKSDTKLIGRTETLTAYSSGIEISTITINITSRI